MARSSEYQPNVMPTRFPDGYVYVNGIRVDEATDIKVDQAVTTESTKVLSQRGETIFESAVSVTGTLTVNRASPIWQDYAERIKNGERPRFQIITQADDESSDYYQRYGVQQYLFEDCAITGPLNLVNLSASQSGPVQDTIEFTAREYKRI